MDQAIFQSVYDTILQRDTKYDGIYYTGIKTTGIVCRPSCKSRTPKRENVQLYKSVDDAIKAGFRPCKRCKPEEIGKMGPDARIAYEVKSFIRKEYSKSITLEDMSIQLMISPFHLHRVFKRITGITPAEFLLLTRLDKAKELLEQRDLAIAQIAKTVGFRSTSHFSMAFKKKVHVTPSNYRDSFTMEGITIEF
ncbi:bifunctional transcriptional activator/DNA repair enzyme AdaA [Shimazuella alba]|uniref:Helix-turn-helix domain-containing protein n=1 Tax=Shimazuella alba TaxID=2690964 RepID=A0A6I4VLG6_9BACL|nr:Ada metal-binding domain-containing protein [Shimazuella alba]MXQ52459.1 helix-turn-helix domain-containing protein [Shimazuella alba]